MSSVNMPFEEVSVIVFDSLLCSYIKIDTLNFRNICNRHWEHTLYKFCISLNNVIIALIYLSLKNGIFTNFEGGR